MSDNITLPREVVERARKALKPLDHYMTVYDRDEIADTLRAALAAPRPEPVFDGQSGHPVMLPRAPVPVLGLISDEVRAALKAADAVESQEAYRTRAALAAPEPEPESKTPAWWVGGLTVTLMREGVNKHRAREIAQGYWEAYCQIPGQEEVPR